MSDVRAEVGCSALLTGAGKPSTLSKRGVPGAPLLSFRFGLSAGTFIQESLHQAQGLASTLYFILQSAHPTSSWASAGGTLEGRRDQGETPAPESLQVRGRGRWTQGPPGDRDDTLWPSMREASRSMQHRSCLGICWTDGAREAFLAAAMVTAEAGWRERAWPDHGRGRCFQLAEVGPRAGSAAASCQVPGTPPPGAGPPSGSCGT